MEKINIYDTYMGTFKACTCGSERYELHGEDIKCLQCGSIVTVYPDEPTFWDNVDPLDYVK